MAPVISPKYCRYSVKHYIIFSIMELNTTATLYFHMGFPYKEIVRERERKRERGREKRMLALYIIITKLHKSKYFY